MIRDHTIQLDFDEIICDEIKRIRFLINYMTQRIINYKVKMNDVINVRDNEKILKKSQ